VLIVDLQERTVSIYRSLVEVTELGENDLLEIQELLPGFSLPIARLFGNR
jgi:Uma2 family endonuclease